MEVSSMNPDEYEKYRYEDVTMFNQCTILLKKPRTMNRKFRWRSIETKRVLMSLYL